jgi:hypothetical protein
MEIFNKLIQREDGQESHALKAVFVDSSLVWGEWAYYIYHYDKSRGIVYINDIWFYKNGMTPSVTNVIEHIAIAIYDNERRQNDDRRFGIPRFVYFSTVRYIWELIMRHEVSLRAVVKKWRIVRFKNPSWDSQREQIIYYKALEVLENL